MSGAKMSAEYMRAYGRANKDRLNARRRERYATEPAYRARLLAATQTPKGRATQRRTRAKNRDRHVGYMRKYNVKKYGLTADAFDAMIASQGGNCASCFETLVPGLRTHVDHCHATKVVRGILCHNCNIALGHAKESPDRLRKLAAYIERFK